MIMAEEKTAREKLLEHQIRILADRQRNLEAEAKTTEKKPSKALFPIESDELVKGIIMREVLGPPKGLER